jgi:putative ABC transport system permease protein
MQDFRYGVRQAIRRPGLSAAIIVMLAVGIGATTAIFSLFHRVLVQPLPVPEPDRLVNIARTGPEGASEGDALSYALFRDLEADQSVFSGLAAQSPFSANLALDEGRALNADAVAVSGSYFQTLNLAPALGRLIGPQDEPRIDEAPVVVLSHALWQGRFGGDQGIVGRVLTINGRPLSVIGVAPERFAGTMRGVRAELFVPLTMRWQLDEGMPREGIESRAFNMMFLLARLRLDVTLEQASAQINTAFGRILREIEAPLRSVRAGELERFLDRRLELVPGGRGHGSIAGAAQTLTLLLGVALLVLLIVCVNIANLLLARGASRAGEMAIRDSLGATRSRLVAQLMIETGLPALAGGLLSLPVAALMLRISELFLPPWFATELATQVSSAALMFAALAVVATTIAVSLLPALRTGRTSPASALKGHAAQVAGGYGAERIRSALVIAQIAFSLVLIVLAGLFAKSLSNVARIDLGLDVDSVLTFDVAPRVSGYGPDRTAVIYAGIEEELGAQPGVTGVAVATIPVMSSRNFQSMYFVEGRDQAEPSVANFNMVSPEFFATLSIPLLAGREFTAADTTGPLNSVIVTERLARQHGLGGDAVGEYLTFGPGAPRMEIVGVVPEAAYSEYKGDNPPMFFIPYMPSGYENPVFNFAAGSLSFYVRASVEPDTLVRVIPEAVANVDPALPVTKVTTLRRHAQEQVFVDRLVTFLSASFAGLATLLAAIGLYGVLAYSMAQRVREFGLRRALGATPAGLRTMVLQRVAVLASIGIAIGLAAALAAGRLADAMLYGLSGHDPFVFVAAVAALGAVVLVASYVPARSASTVVPMEALRHE